MRVWTSPTCTGNGGSWGPSAAGEVGAGAAICASNLPFPLQLWCERVNPENKAALEAWVRETGIRLVQVNGQRKYGGPPPGTLAPGLRLPGYASLDGRDLLLCGRRLPRGSPVGNP